MVTIRRALSSADGTILGGHESVSEKGRQDAEQLAVTAFEYEEEKLTATTAAATRSTGATAPDISYGHTHGNDYRLWNSQ